MRRSFDNFAIVDSGLANNVNREAFLNVTGVPPYLSGMVTSGTGSTSTPPPYLSGMVPTTTTTFDPLAGTGIPYSTNIPTYTSGQQTSSGGFLSNLTAQELNTLGQTVGGLTAAILQIRQQSLQAQSVEEQQRLQAEALNLERQRIEAMNALADAQRRAGVPVTAGGQGLSTGAIVGIVAGGVLVIGLILFLALKPKN
jgi:hypothetical protein